VELFSGVVALGVFGKNNFHAGTHRRRVIGLKAVDLEPKKDRVKRFSDSMNLRHVNAP